MKDQDQKAADYYLRHGWDQDFIEAHEVRRAFLAGIKHERKRAQGLWVNRFRKEIEDGLESMSAFYERLPPRTFSPKAPEPENTYRIALDEMPKEDLRIPIKEDPTLSSDQWQLRCPGDVLFDSKDKKCQRCGADSGKALYCSDKCYFIHVSEEDREK